MRTILKGILSDVRREGNKTLATLRSENGNDTLLVLKPIGEKILKGYAERSFTVRVKGWMQEELHQSFHVTNLTGYLKIAS
ncbi:hypothetical protein EI427_01485 [Flammeovirga pectinis]|uniref:Uncharacterized protein n=1 Tax=Flammeovirga pectinis TaxID=2494373 RepID=A0A3Q9FJ97_9BACT|nr:hypothetical protein [Flammeovirga pectinis]AZQ60931.1 hypothetical protein EI427_01485 [Flammeovirga pectinis]